MNYKKDFLNNTQENDKDLNLSSFVYSSKEIIKNKTDISLLQHKEDENNNDVFSEDAKRVFEEPLYKD
jgi:hypothetical protein